MPRRLAISALALAAPVLAATCLSAAVATPAAAQAAAPNPNLGDRSWALDFANDKPEAIYVDGQWYWYITYTVTNNSRQQVRYLPRVTVQASNGQILDAPMVVDPQLVDAIRAASGNDLLVNPGEVAGEIREGSDFARQSFFVWPDFNGDVDHFSLFVQGLSGEVQSFTHPTTGETIRLRRNLMIRYSTPGNPTTPDEATVTEQSRENVMR